MILGGVNKAACLSLARSAVFPLTWPMDCVFCVLLVLALLSSVEIALAQDRGHVLLSSYHAMPLRDEFDYQETNPGLVLTWNAAWQNYDVSVGAFHNSFDATSALVGLSKPLGATGAIDWRAVAALATYDVEDPIFQPIGGGLVLIPAVQAEIGRTFVQITPLPDPDNAGLVFSFGLVHDF